MVRHSARPGALRMEAQARELLLKSDNLRVANRSGYIGRKCYRDSFQPDL